MSNEEILTKAIQKAIDGGWEFDNYDKWEWKAVQRIETVMNDWYYFEVTYGNEMRVIDAYRVIFHALFAQALWPGYDLEPDAAEFIGKEPRPYWKYHLQQMVVADDPIEYLGNNLEG